MKKLVLKVTAIIFLIGILVTAYFVVDGYSLYREALSDKSVQDMAEEIAGIDNYTTLAEVPQIYLQAVIAVEDHNFYEHNGVDVSAIGRAILRNIQSFSYVEGGSTITQQLAKNEYFTQEKKMSRKVADAFMALQIEKEFSKDEILELYINSIYFGSGYYGIFAASQGYYGKEPSELNAYEATMLAGIPNAPSAYSLDSNPQLAKERQLQVLKLMVKRDIISEEEKDLILQMGG